MTALSKISIAIGGMIVVAGTALAQPAPPPPPSGGGMDPTGGAVEPKMRFEASLIAGLPQADLGSGTNGLGADTSPGIGLGFGYTVAPNISIGAGLRYFSIQGGPSGVSFGNYDLDASARYSIPISPTAKGFVEGMLIYSTFSASAQGQSQSESGIGFGGRGGAMFAVNPSLSVGGAVSYTTASISSMGADATLAWLGIEGFISYGF